MSAPSCRRPPAHVVSITQPGAFRPLRSPAARELCCDSLFREEPSPARVATLGSGSGLSFAGLSNCGHDRAAPREAGCRLLAAGCWRCGKARLLRSGSPGIAGPAPSLQMLAKANTQQMTGASGTLERPLVLSGWPSPQPVSPHSDSLPVPSSIWGTIL